VTEEALTCRSPLPDRFGPYINGEERLQI